MTLTETTSSYGPAAARLGAALGMARLGVPAPLAAVGTGGVEGALAANDAPQGEKLRKGLTYGLSVTAGRLSGLLAHAALKGALRGAVENELRRPVADSTVGGRLALLLSTSIGQGLIGAAGHGAGMYAAKKIHEKTSAYAAGSTAVATALGLEKTAFWGTLAPWLIRTLAPAGARAVTGTGLRGVGQALMSRFAANKGSMAIGGLMGALSPGNGAEKGMNAGIQAVSGAFGMPGMMLGSLVGPMASNKMFGSPPPPQYPGYGG